MIAKVAVAAAIYAIDKPYSYRVPASMSLQPGMRVMVPFGRGNRPTEGVVLQLVSGEEEKLKDISACLDEEPVLDQELLQLAGFLRERYFCTFYEAIKAILPGGLWFSAKQTYTLAKPLPENWRQQCCQPFAVEVVEFLSTMGGAGDERALARRFPQRQQLQEALGLLQRKKLITAAAAMQRRSKDKTEKIAELAVTAEEALAYGATRRKSAPLQASVLEMVATVGRISVKELLYFTGASMATVNRLSNLGYLSLSCQEVFRRHQAQPGGQAAGQTDGFVLTPEQEQVYEGLRCQMKEDIPGVALLYGVTGSGKTAIYVQLIRQCLAENQTAMLLVPEIALTPQLLHLFTGCFGDKVAVLHSSLAVGERYDEWKRIRQGHAQVVLGTRSAVFAPVRHLGLILVDEEQEHSYKSENSPRYHTAEVAIYRGAKQNALVLLGSATPSVESMYRAKQGIYRLYTLRQRYNGRSLPPVEIVDMKQQLREGNPGAVSSVLRQAILDHVEKKQKTILLLNRRGGSPLTVCVDCGQVPQCPRCSVHLTYHLANGRLMCHYCGYSEPYTTSCPACGGHRKLTGFGTQRVQQELETLLPGREILRMDSDTVSATNSHEKLLSRFAKEDIPVLVGTQMVAKGLNFEAVTLVGVMDADMSLYVDHYRAAETTFSLITQVVGRAGRGKTQGRAIVQTMTPKNQVITLAAAQDYEQFYQLEIGLRQAKGCPPFRDLLCIGFSGFPEQQVQRAAAGFRDRLAAALAQPAYGSQQTTLLGPAPASVAKVNNRYRYRLTLCCKNSREIRRLLSAALREFAGQKENKGVAAFIDVNGYN